jgi:hypothetical protein
VDLAVVLAMRAQRILERRDPLAVDAGDRAEEAAVVRQGRAGESRRIAELARQPAGIEQRPAWRSASPWAMTRSQRRAGVSAGRCASMRLTAWR